jgi:hypothetical protein
MERRISKGTRAPFAGELYCPEGKRLLEQFGEAVQELMLLHESQFQAVVEDDLDANRFDILIHYANERKQNAKYAYMSHLDEHGCMITDETDTGRARANDRQYFEDPVGAAESGRN